MQVIQTENFKKKDEKNKKDVILDIWSDYEEQKMVRTDTVWSLIFTGFKLLIYAIIKSVENAIWFDGN